MNIHSTNIYYINFYDLDIKNLNKLVSLKLYVHNFVYYGICEWVII